MSVITDFIHCFKGDEELKGRKGARKEKNRKKENNVEAIINY